MYKKITNYFNLFGPFIYFGLFIVSKFFLNTEKNHVKQ